MLTNLPRRITALLFLGASKNSIIVRISTNFIYMDIIYPYITLLFKKSH